MKKDLFYILLFSSNFCMAQNEIYVQPADPSILNNPNLALIPGYDDTQYSDVMPGLEFEQIDITPKSNIEPVKSGFSSGQNNKGDALDRIIEQTTSKPSISGGFTPIEETHNQNSDGSWSPKGDSRIGNRIANDKSITKKIEEDVDSYFKSESESLSITLKQEERRLNRILFFSFLLIIGIGLYWIIKSKKISKYKF